MLQNKNSLYNNNNNNNNNHYNFYGVRNTRRTHLHPVVVLSPTFFLFGACRLSLTQPSRPGTSRHLPPGKGDGAVIFCCSSILSTSKPVLYVFTMEIETLTSGKGRRLQLYSVAVVSCLSLHLSSVFSLWTSRHLPPGQDDGCSYILLQLYLVDI